MVNLPFACGLPRITKIELLLKSQLYCSDSGEIPHGTHMKIPIWRFPKGGTPKGSISRWDFPLYTIHVGVPILMETSLFWWYSPNPMSESQLHPSWFTCQKYNTSCPHYSKSVSYTIKPPMLAGWNHHLSLASNEITVFVLLNSYIQHPRKLYTTKKKHTITEHHQQKTPNNTHENAPKNRSKSHKTTTKTSENHQVFPPEWCLQHRRSFAAQGPVLRHAAARGAAAQRGLKAEDEGELGHFGEWMVILEGFYRDFCYSDLLGWCFFYFIDDILLMIFYSEFIVTFMESQYDSWWFFLWLVYLPFSEDNDHQPLGQWMVGLWYFITRLWDWIWNLSYGIMAEWLV